MVEKRTRSRRRNVEVDVGAKELTSWTCRKCLITRPNKDFYKATDSWDSNGHMSICRFCIEDAYAKIFLTEKTVEKTILALCKKLNVKYDIITIEKVKQYLNDALEKGKVTNAVFGIYRKFLISAEGIVNFDPNDDLSFQGLSEFVPSDELYKSEVSEEDKRYLEETWGKGLNIEDYEFLEERFSRWTRTTEVDNYGVEILLRELCHKENDIRKARLQNNSVDGFLKSLQELMKNSALTPQLQNAAATGKSADAFGVWIKDIETETPAEWYEHQDKYKDIDGIEEYNKKYVERSIKNFITGSRDFSVEEALGLDNESLDDE